MNWQREHANYYTRIRTDPFYRMCEMNADIACLLEPAWGSKPRPQITETIVQRVITNDRIEQMHYKMLYLENKLKELQAGKKKPKDKLSDYVTKLQQYGVTNLQNERGRVTNTSENSDGITLE